MKNKSKLIILQVFIAIVLVCTSVYATIETTIGVKVSKSTLKQGDEFQVTLSLEDVKENQKIKNVEGYINYNKDILEKITYDSIVKDKDKKVKIGEETLKVEDLTNGDVTPSSAYVGFNGSPDSDNDVRIVIDFNNGLTKDTELLNIKFKVKENAEVKDVKEAIKYAFTASDGTEKSEEDMTANVNLTIEKKSEQPAEDKNKNEAKDENEVGKVDDKNKNKNTNTNTNTNTNKNKNNTVNNTNTSDNSVAGAKLPAAGAKIFIIPAIILIALAYISYNRYIRMRGI